MGRIAADTKSRFGHLMREQRAKLGLTKEDLAKPLGLSAAYIDAIEVGRRGCNLDMLPRLAGKLNLPTATLVREYLLERHHDIYDALFGDAAPPLPGAGGHTIPVVEDVHWLLDHLPRRERGIIEALVYTLDDLISREERGR